MLFVVIAGVAVGLSALLAWSYPRRAARLCSLDGRGWQKDLETLSPANRIARLRQHAVAGSWEAELGAELAAARDDRARAVAFNEALASAEHDLEARAQRPRAAFWLALASAATCAVAGFLAGARRELLYLVPIAFVGVAICLQAARSGRRRAAQQRANIDALVSAVAGEIAKRDLDLPERRRMRWRRRR